MRFRTFQPLHYIFCSAVNYRSDLSLNHRRWPPDNHWA